MLDKQELAPGLWLQIPLMQGMAAGYFIQIFQNRALRKLKPLDSFDDLV